MPHEGSQYFPDFLNTCTYTGTILQVKNLLKAGLCKNIGNKGFSNVDIVNKPIRVQFSLNNILTTKHLNMWFAPR